MTSRIAAGWVTLLAVLGAGQAAAQTAVSVPVELISVSNPGLAVGGAGSVVILRATPQYTVASVNGNARTELSVGATIERSSNTALSSNREDPNLRLLWESTSAVSVLQLRASVEEASTRETEFSEFGQTVLDGTQRTASLGATWTRQLSASQSLEVGAVHASVDYDLPSFVDYRETRGLASYRVEASPTTRYIVGTSISRLRFDSPGTAATRTGVSLGLERDLTQSLALLGSVGATRVSAPARDTVGVASVRLNYTGERFRASAAIARDVSASGTLVRYVPSQTAEFSAGYSLTSSTDLSAGVSQSRTRESLRTTGTTAFVRVRSTLSERWTAIAGLDHRRSEGVGGIAARSNGVSVGLVYAFSSL